jgi:hydrogenase 3 maturation protease
MPPTSLNNLLKDTSKHILFIGIGNILKSDDGIGVYVSNHIQPTNKFSSLTVEVSIENYIGKINKLKPDILVLIDCVDFKKEPGYFKLIPVQRIRDFTVHTHNISLKNISELFTMPVWILGIQPKNTSFGEKLSPEIKKTANYLIGIINNETTGFDK